MDQEQFRIVDIRSICDVLVKVRVNCPQLCFQIFIFSNNLHRATVFKIPSRYEAVKIFCEQYFVNYLASQKPLGHRRVESVSALCSFRYFLSPLQINISKIINLFGLSRD